MLLYYSAKDVLGKKKKAKLEATIFRVVCVSAGKGKSNLAHLFSRIQRYK